MDLHFPTANDRLFKSKSLSNSPVEASVISASSSRLCPKIVALVTLFGLASPLPLRPQLQFFANLISTATVVSLILSACRDGEEKARECAVGTVGGTPHHRLTSNGAFKLCKRCNCENATCPSAGQLRGTDGNSGDKLSAH